MEMYNSTEANSTIHLNCEATDSTVNENFTWMNYPGDATLFKNLDPQDYAKIVTYVLVIVGSLLGNISVILTVALNRSMRTTINFYVVNLAVADLLICTCCMSVHFIHSLVTNSYVFGEFMCKFNSFNQVTCLICSVLTLSAIACDRFIAIMFPLHVRITKQRTGVVITVIWFLSAAASLPLLIVRKHYVLIFRNFQQAVCSEYWPVVGAYDEELNQCIQTKPLQKFYYTFATVTLFFLPVTIMATAYFLIIWRLYVTRVPGETHAANVNVQNRSKRKVIKMVFVVLVAFIVCWMPLQVLLLYDQYRESRKVGAALPPWFIEADFFAHFLAYSNSFMNPIIYGGFNKTFRESLLMVLKCQMRRPHLSRPQASQRSRMTFTTGITSSPSNCMTKVINGGSGPGGRSPVNLEIKSFAHPTSNTCLLGSRHVKDTCITYSPDGKAVGTYT